ncbi:MAG: M15 family metallopeptidase [Longimicrobiales bacterium]
MDLIRRRPVRWVALVLAAATAAAMARSPSVADDLRVRAFLEAYGPLIDSVRYLEDDAVFYLHLGREPIHFRDGRMVAASRLGDAASCDPGFYPYPLGPLTEVPPPPPDELPNYCTDVMESLWGKTEAEVREHGRSVRFLDHRMFLNGFLVAPLAAAEEQILDAATTDTEVAAWIAGMSVMYSLVTRDIAGTDTPSQHAWGLAFDLVPSSYEGRHVYWRWSRALDREGWSRIPVEQRWSPPARVVQIFEQHGFVWGGKWTLFDAIHFEYRPEVLVYNRMLRDGR